MQLYTATMRIINPVVEMFIVDLFLNNELHPLLCINVLFIVAQDCSIFNVQNFVIMQGGLKSSMYMRHIAKVISFGCFRIIKCKKV